MPQEYETFQDEENDSEYKKKKQSCTRMEKQLSVLVVICFIFLVAMAALLVVNYVIKTEKESCNTAACVQTAGEILKSMDLSADPCQDFYQFACGNYAETTMIPPDKAKWETFSELMRKNRVIVNKVLQQDGNLYKGTNSTAIQKAKDYYTACMNTSVVEDSGKQPAMKIIKDMGGWSIAKDEASGLWNEDTWDFLDTIVKANMYGTSPFYDMTVGADDKNSSVNIIAFDQGGITFSDKMFYLGNDSSKFHDALVHYIKRVGNLLESDTSKTSQMAEDIWQLELAMAKITDPKKKKVPTATLR